MSNFSSLYSLYIHWPFCSKKCYYCDFVAFEQHEDFQEHYHQALIKEIELFVKHNPEYNKNIETIFIGGGTPSLYPLDLMKNLFDVLRKHFNFSTLKEISMEANPADITEEQLDAWESFGINRLSIGVQVLDDEILFKLNRRQRTRDVELASKIVPKYFDNFSMDFILGLPDVKQKTWFNSIDHAILSGAQHISVYFLMIHERTPLYFKIKKGEFQLGDDDELIDLYEQTISRLEANGFEQYEISNFAKPGYASIHNQAYWNQKTYKGFGIGACSYDGEKRFNNEKNLMRYIERVEKNDYEGIFSTETLSDYQKKIETMMLGLRQKRGLGLHRMVYLLKDKEKKRFYADLEALKSHGLIIEREGTLSLTSRGMALENEVLLKLI